MERLTVKLNGTYEIKGIEDVPCGDVCERNYGCETCKIHKAVDKLAEYEDIEEKITKKFAGCIDIKTILDSFCAFYDMQETKEELAQCTLLTNEDVLKYRQWKDAEEQGLLLKLPCKVGGMLYRPYCYINGAKGIDELVVDVVSVKIDIEEGKTSYIVAHFANTNCGVDVEFSEIGKTVFLTKEEAEQALTRMENG